MFRFRKKKLRKESKRLPIKSFPNEDSGLKDDEGIWYHCWYCGFINDETQNALGGSASRSGVGLEDYSTPSRIDDNNQIMLGGPINNFQVILELDSDGNPKVIQHDLRPTVSSGCPQCGSLNWRGDF